MIFLLESILLIGSICFASAFPRLQFPTVGVPALAILFLAWIISIFLTHKHRPKFYQIKIKYITAPFIKAGIIMLAAVWLLCYLFSLEQPSMELLLSISLFYIVIEMAILIMWCFFRRTTTRPADEALYDLFSDKKQIQTDLINKNEGHAAQTVDLESLRRIIVDEDKDQIIEFITHNIPVTHIKNGMVYENPCLIVTAEGLNDAKDLNRLLSSCYDQMLAGGWIIFKYKDMGIKTKEWQRQYQGILFYSVYLSQILLHRLLPTIPGFMWLYLAMTKGRRRLLHRVEVWGRMSYCGFDVVKEKTIGYDQYLIARKTKTHSDNPNPSYYPLIKLDRVGLYGKIIKIHKIRTMYPYSEFLQKQVFEENQLSTTGKMNNDYRITKVGQILRKYWMDELPQFIDWLRGEIKLVGIRAMSLHFFSLYPREYQELFINVKPGILSPVFDEATVDFTQIVETEAKYLRSYLQKPVRTDIKYFFKTIYQILFQGTRGQ